MNKRYINQIIRKLKCSKKRREEIKKQLISEIENCENPQEVISRMGTPAEIAEEFNNSFSVEEKKAYKREKWMKILGSILLIIIVICGLIFWAMPKQIWIEDSKIFDRDIVTKQAETVVKYLDNDDYESLKGISDEKMQEYFAVNDLEDYQALIGTDWGEQESIGNIYIVELTQYGRKSAVVQMHVQYENQNVMYTIYFNKNMELEGLWMQ